MTNTETFYDTLRAAVKAHDAGDLSAEDVVGSIRSYLALEDLPPCPRCNERFHKCKPVSFSVLRTCCSECHSWREPGSSS